MKSLLFFQTLDRGWPAYGRLGRQTSARRRTPARLQITFVDMTYPKGWTESLPLCPLIFSWLNLFVEFRFQLFSMKTLFYFELRVSAGVIENLKTIDITLIPTTFISTVLTTK